MKTTLQFLLMGSLLTAVPGCLLAKEAAEPKLPKPVISEKNTFPTQSVDVLGSSMTYVEAGSGDTVLFVHGNPSSSHLWRNVIPFASKAHRTLAVDLTGMGNSDKPNIEYTFSDHYRYLSAYIDEMKLNDFTLVGHDWGAALAWEYARLNPNKVNKLAFMEGVLPPRFPAPSFEAISLYSVDWYTDTIANLEAQFVGQGLHFFQEDQPESVGRAVSDWLRRH